MNSLLISRVQFSPTCQFLTGRYLSPLLVLFFLAPLAQGQEPITLTGHQDGVVQSLYVPGGKLVVTCGHDRTVRIWQATDGKLIRTLQGHQGQVLSLAVAANGRRLISGGRDNSIRLWDLFIPDPLKQRSAHQLAVTALLVGPEGTWQATGSTDKTVRLVPAADGEPMSMDQHADAITTLGTNGTGTLLASGDASGRLLLWNPADGQLIGNLGAHQGALAGVAFHPSKPQMISAGANGTVKHWTLPLQSPLVLPAHETEITEVLFGPKSQLAYVADLATLQAINVADGKPLRSFAGSQAPITSLATNTAGTVLVAATREGEVRFWNTEDGSATGLIHGHTGAVHDVVLHPTEPRGMSAGADGTIRIWKFPVSPRPLAGHTAPIRVISVSPDGKLLATGSDDKTIRLWNPVDGTSAQTIAPDGADALLALAFQPDSAQLASGDAAGVIRLSNVANGAPLAELKGHNSAVTALAYRPDAKQLVSSGADGLVKWWNLPLTADRTVATLPIEISTAVTDGKTIVSGATDGSILQTDVATGNQVRAFSGHVGTVASLGLHPLGTQLASGQADGAIHLYNMADGVLLGSVRGHSGSVHSLALHPLLPQLISAGADGTIRVWQLPAKPTVTAGTPTTVQAAALSADKTLLAIAATIANKPTIQIRNTSNGQVTATLVGHTGAITSLGFSPDKTRLISGSADKTARIWTVASPTAEPVLLEGHTAAVTAVAFASNPAHVFTGAGDNTVRQWTIADGKQLRVLSGHSMAITSLAVAGTVLSSSSGDGTVRLWNTADGAAIRSVSHGGPASLACISADGKHLASVGTGNVIKLWTVANGAALATLSAHGANVTSLNFSSDGQRLLSCGGTDIRVWNLQGVLLEQIAVTAATGLLVQFAAKDAGYLGVDTNNGLRRGSYALQRVITGHAGAVNRVLLSTDGNSIFSAGADKVIRRTVLATGAPQATLTGADGEIQDLALTADGKQLVAAVASGKIHRWDLATATANNALPAAITFVADDKSVVRVAINMDGTRILTVNGVGLLRMWDGTSGLQLQQLSGHSGRVPAVFLSNDATSILSAGQDKTVRAWKPAVERVIRVSEQSPSGLAWSPDGKTLALAGPDNVLRVWDQATGAVKQTLPAGEKPLVTVAIPKDGGRIVAGGGDGNLYSWPVTLGTAGALATVATNAPITRIDFDSNGSRLLVIGADKQIRIFDGQATTLIERFELPVAAIDGTIAVDGQSVVSASGNEAAVLQLSVLSVINGHKGAVTALALKADGSQLISGGMDMTVRLWTVADGAPAGTLAGPTAAITGLSVSDDATRMFASSDDKNVYGWTLAANPANLAADLTLPHPGAVLNLSLSKDKARLLTSSADGQARAWDLPSGLLLESFSGHQGPATALSLAADGKSLVTGGTDKTVRFWKIAAEHVFAADAEKLTAFGMLPDGSQIAVIGTEPAVKWFDATGKPLRQLTGAKAALAKLAIRLDGQQASAADANGSVLVWNLVDGALLKTIESGAATSALVFGSDNKSLLVAGNDNHLRVYDPTEGVLLQDQVAEAAQTVLASLPGGKDFLTADATGTVSHWALAQPSQLLMVNGHKAVYGLDLNGDATMAASSGADNMIQLWDLTSGLAIRQLAGHEGPVYSVRFNSDDKSIVSASADGSIRIWNVANGAEVKKMVLPRDQQEPVTPVYDAIFSPSDELIATAGSDGTVHLWNVASGQLVRTIGKPGEAIYRVLFSKSGTRLLACGHAGTLTVHNVADGAAVFTTKLPSVAYSAHYAPGGASVAAACANGMSYLIPIPQGAQ
jgi:WD40 repeat protein